MTGRDYLAAVIAMCQQAVDSGDDREVTAALRTLAAPSPVLRDLARAPEVEHVDRG